MTKHTPGPWAVEDPMGFELSIVEAGKPPHEWRFIASCALPKGDDDQDFTAREVHANAKLVAAAPEMLEALQAAERWLDGWASAEPYIGVIRRAIAKALD